MDGLPIDPESEQGIEPGAGLWPKRAVCLVLSAAERPRPQVLLSGLAKRGADVSLLTHPVQVMVRLAKSPHAAVLIDEPLPQSQRESLLKALGRYYPRAVCWVFDRSADSGRGRLTRVGDPVDSGTDASERTEDRDIAPQGVELHLSDNPVQDDGQDKAVPSGPRVANGESSGELLGTSRVVSAEELAMLMGPMVQEQDG